MNPLRSVLLALVPLAMLVTACSSYEPPRPDTSALSKRETGVRQDCNAIMGTAFRAAEEREWFEQNCSRWPSVSAAVIPAAAPGQQPAGARAVQGDSPECAAMRGRPYANEQERAWFLQNCIRPESPAPNPGPSGQAAQPGQPQPQQQRPGTAPAPAGNPNAQVCETLRRSPTVTDEQRRWYFTYCNIR